MLNAAMCSGLRDKSEKGSRNYYRNLARIGSYAPDALFKPAQSPLWLIEPRLQPAT